MVSQEAVSHSQGSCVMATLAKSLVVLRQQANEQWPNRSKASDGWIGDASHAATASDHNPNQYGDVCAFDLTHDPSNGCNCDAIAESIRLHPQKDLKYLIWNGRIFRAYDKPGIPAFTWAEYTGASKHAEHIHTSVGVGPDGHSRQPYDDTDLWNIISAQDVPATVPKQTEDEEMGIMLSRPGVIYHLVSGKIVGLRDEAFFWELAGKGVQVVDVKNDKQMDAYVTAFGQPI
jgi:hypothetical protein